MPNTQLIKIQDKITCFVTLSREKLSIAKPEMQ